MPYEVVDPVGYFEKCVLEFIDLFQLNDFELTIEAYDEPEKRASCYWHDLDTGAQILSIYYSSTWVAKAGQKEIRRVAFHEVCEGLLSEIQEVAKHRYIQEREITTAVHRVIRKLENAMLPSIKEI